MSYSVHAGKYQRLSVSEMRYHEEALLQVHTIFISLFTFHKYCITFQHCYTQFL